MAWAKSTLAFLLLLVCAAACEGPGKGPAADAPSPYMKACKDAGVPLPPKWPDSAWKRRLPDLPKEKTFDSDLPTTEVWVAETDLGVCYALPRKTVDGEIKNLGMICQGKKTGKACFWDNIAADTGNQITGKDITLDPAKIRDGSNLAENCTECHRGDNVFLITPKTALDLSPDEEMLGKRKTDVDTPPYEPLSGGRKDQVWENPVRGKGDKLTGSGEGCQFCHSIPPVTKKYCGLLNALTKGKLMPPSGKMDADEIKDVKRLKQECLEAGYTWED